MELCIFTRILRLDSSFFLILLYINLDSTLCRTIIGDTYRFSILAITVVDLLEKIASIRGYPQNVRLDNGPENIPKALAAWALKNKINLLFIQPGATCSECIH